MSRTVGADLVPLRAVAAQAAQDHRIALGQFNVIVIRVFSPDRDRVGRDVGRWIETRRHRIGDDFSALGRSNLKKIVTEKFNRYVRLGGERGL